MKQKDLISSIVLLVLAIGILLEAGKMPIGSLSVPRSGFWPFILGIALIILSLILLGQAIKEKNEVGSSFWTRRGNWKSICLVLGALFTFPFFFENLGFRISVFILVCFLLRVIEPMKWWLVITVALSTSLGSHLLFGLVLKTYLPVGILGI